MLLVGKTWHGELSGRVLDLRSESCRLEPHRQHCVVSLSKTHYPRISLLSTGSTQEDPSRLGRKESNKAKQFTWLGQSRISVVGKTWLGQSGVPVVGKSWLKPTDLLMGFL